MIPVRYEPVRLDGIAAREARHFWFVPRRRLLTSLVARRVAPGARVLDAGCGTGSMVEALCAVGLRACGVDPHVLQRGLPANRYSAGTLDRLPFEDGVFDGVCAFDVLEHVDDGPAVRELRRVTRPGGLLFASVPAYAWLWSARDEEAGHLRRYTRGSLRGLLQDHGLEIVQLFGYQLFLLPLVAAHRFSGRRDSVAREDQAPPLLNAALRLVNEFEVRLAPLWRPPLGSSLVVCARKPS